MSRDVEMEENEHQNEEPPLSIGNAEKKNVEQYLKPELHCCIYRIPQFIAKLNKAAYTPMFISIGPLHYGNEELMRTESQKKRYWTKFEERLGPRSSEVVQKLKSYIQEEEQYIRAYYSVTSNLQSSEFAALILGDVIFIMELFVMAYRKEIDFLLAPPMGSYLLVDLLLLENQLPYSLLSHLYSIAFPDCGGNPCFFKLCFAGFNRLPYVSWNLSSISAEQRQFKHFTDFLRCVLIMEAKQALKLDKVISDLPCATKLSNSGLEFKGTGGSLLNIRCAKTKKYGKWLRWFEANELQIRTLVIDDNAEILFRNLMAWEMFRYPEEAYICSYIDLMDSLIEKGIIVNFVGDNEVIAKMFNRLCLNVKLSGSCYYDTVEKMKAHYKNPWNRAKAMLKIVYFSNLWTGTATVAATFLLIFTLMQTICSVIQVYQGYTK